MSSSEKFVVQDGQVYGRLQAGFQIELGEKGYFSIAGLNNSGKTTVLQWLVTTQVGSGRDYSNTHGRHSVGHQGGAGVLLREVCTYR